MVREFKDVHDRHCCKKHGCKYSDPNCTVFYGPNEGIECEECEYDEEEKQVSLKDILAIVEKSTESFSNTLVRQLVIDAYNAGKQSDNDLGIEHWISYEDRRHPTLALRCDNFGTVGYSLNMSNGDLERVCICNAYSSTECVCGAWD